MSALSIYALVCRNLLQLNSLDDPNSEVWEDTVRKIRRLRHVVQCRVCKFIAKDPYGASGCNHVTCRDCKQSKKGYFSGCRYCKNPTALERDKQTEVVLKCYAKVCEILQSYHANGICSHRKDRIEKIKDLVCEGVTLFEKEDTKIRRFEQLGSTLETSQLLYPTDGIKEQHRESDVDHVLYENKLSQDGRSFQDGRRIQDGGPNKFKHELNPEEDSDFLDRMDERLHSDSHSKSELKLDLGINPHQKVNGHLTLRNETQEANVPKRCVRKEKQSRQFNLASSVVNDSAHSEIHAVKQEYLDEKGIVLEESLNGYSCKELLNTIDNSGISPQKHSKRKSNSEIAPSIEKERKTIGDGDVMESQNTLKYHTADELNSQEASEHFGNKSNQYCKALRHCHRNENKLFTKQEEVCIQDRDQLAGKKGRQSIRHRPYSLMRKNKYKCMCGSGSGFKQITDICSHRRCVCFAAGVPCVSCKCRFCSNPHKSHYSVKWSTLGIESDMRPIKVEQLNEDGL